MRWDGIGLTNLVLNACGGKKQRRLAHHIILLPILQESSTSQPQSSMNEAPAKSRR